MIRVGNRFGIIVEADNYILQRIKIRGEKSKKLGEEYFETLGYYSSLESALVAAQKVAEKDSLSYVDMELRDAIEAVREVHKEFALLVSDVLMR